MSLLALDHIGVERHRRAVLRDVTLRVEPGEVVGLIGPNGAGKTTLLRAALGLLPHSGSSSLATLPPARRARLAAFLPQAREVAWAVTVEALVALGRLPHLGPGARPSPADRAAIDRAIARMDLEALRHRPATEISGGEQARALIARALAQETPLLLADEPVAGLDPAAQIAAMAVFRAVAQEGRGVLVSLHDLGLAARSCTRLVALSGGRVVADGPPAAVLSDDFLARVFGVRAHVTATAEGLIVQPVAVVQDMH